MLSAATPRLPVYRRQPPVGWNLHAPPSGPKSQFAAEPVSSFGDHPMRSSSGRANLGGGTATRPPATGVVRSKTGLYGFVISHQDKFGSSTATMATAKSWSPEELTDWTKRPHFGEVPSYLRTQRSWDGLTDRSMSSSLRVSEETMRMTEHPLSWSRLRSRASQPNGFTMSSGLSSSRSVSTMKCCTFGLSPPFSGPSSWNLAHSRSSPALQPIKPPWRHPSPSASRHEA